MQCLEQVAPPGPGRRVRRVVRPEFRVNKSYVFSYLPALHSIGLEMYVRYIIQQHVWLPTEWRETSVNSNRVLRKGRWLPGTCPERRYYLYVTDLKQSQRCIRAAFGPFEFESLPSELIVSTETSLLSRSSRRKR